VNDLNPQQVSNILWGCATLQTKVPALLDVVPMVAKAAITSGPDMDNQAVANSIWAIATLKRRPPQAMQALPVLLEKAANASTSMNEQDLSNIIWAIAVLRPNARETAAHLPDLLVGVLRHADTMRPLPISSIVWSIGQTHLQDALSLEVLQCLAARAARSLEQFSTQHLANFCWGLALCKFQDQNIMNRLAAETLRRSPSLQDKAADFDLPQIACSFAKLGIHHGTMLQAISHRILPMLHRVNDWGLCALAWSFTEMDRDDRFVDFKQKLQAEVARRRLSTSDVKRSQNGPEAWWKKTS